MLDQSAAIVGADAVAWARPGLLEVVTVFLGRRPPRFRCLIANADPSFRSAP